MKVEVLDQIIEKLEQLPATSFYFGQVVSIWDMENHCGSVCCVVGHFPNWFPDQVQFKPRTIGRLFPSFLHGGEELGYEGAAAKMLDIHPYVAAKIFSPHNQKSLSCLLKNLDPQATPVEVAEMLRKVKEMYLEGTLDLGHYTNDY